MGHSTTVINRRGPPTPSTGITDPTEIADCVLWLDADDASSVSTTGDLLDQWNDKSGAAITGNFTPHDVTQKCNYGLVGDRINGRNVVNFPQFGFPSPGSELALKGTGTASLKGADGMSVFGVIEADNTQYQYTTQNTYQNYVPNSTSPTTTYTYTTTSTTTTTWPNESGPWLYKGINSTYMVEYRLDPEGTFYSRGSGGPPTADGVGFGSTTLNPAILSSVINDTGAQAVATSYRDGALIQTDPDFVAYSDNAASVTAHPHYIGAHLQIAYSSVIVPFVGSIAEIVVYDRNLTTQEVSDVHDYLSTKWGVTLAP